VDELLSALRRDEAYHRRSGGGVTFSGGEPLTNGNAAFVLACLRRLEDDGVHTAVDTCGHVSADHLLAAAALADVVLFDLKLMDPVRHALATGHDNTQILANLTALLAAGHDVRIRVPLVPGHTDDPDNLQAMADFLHGQAALPPVDLLPYHALGRDKHARLGRAGGLAGTPTMTDAQAAACAALLTSRGLQVHVGG
jgi:pyruvate formate lyase activating enzyme